MDRIAFYAKHERFITHTIGPNHGPYVLKPSSELDSKRMKALASSYLTDFYNFVMPKLAKI